MKIIQLTILSILFSVLSCEKSKSNPISQELLKLKINELKKRDSLEIQELRKFQKIDSLSKYKVSEMEKFLDSLKINDSIKYFSLRKALEKDTINYYEDYQLINLFKISKMRSENEYIELAKKEILSEQK